ncbi:MAG: type II toxin-antitoxin system RelE/ParE family toxin [Acidobacteria bacterium]|nr:type II toxin-antitoxin system RelE/ParE family toxin [Acidobacteriota bacterium]MCZ6491999.1 type II toxin-antitoxin system RelE/ParE family toxin [Acidobacteriota bacterium]MCZ6751240.1 type II toxin-antitoxin system RelE/ParE family toxin [Acidobacteriota bacterium]
MIRNFADSRTRQFWETGKSKGMPPASLRRVALRKLLLIDSAGTLDDLRVPPGNRLEQLKGNRRGQHGIRINDQFRICFLWRQGNAYDVEITDYH